MGDSRFKKAFQRMVASDSEREAESLQEQSARTGAVAVKSCGAGHQVCVSGEVRSTRVDSRGGSPVLEVEVFDGTGTLTVVFLGRRQVAGITTGRGLTVRGRLSHSAGGQPTMFNPAYELISTVPAA